MATIQKVTETASRTKPRSAPINVDPSKSSIMTTSANRSPIQAMQGPAQFAKNIFYRSLGEAVVKPVANVKSRSGGHYGGSMPLRLELCRGPFGRFAIREGSGAHAIMQALPRTARRHIHGHSLCFQLEQQIIRVGATGKTAQLHGPILPSCGYGGRRGRFNRCRVSGNRGAGGRGG